MLVYFPCIIYHCGPVFMLSPTGLERLLPYEEWNLLCRLVCTIFYSLSAYPGARKKTRLPLHLCFSAGTCLQFRFFMYLDCIQAGTLSRISASTTISVVFTISPSRLHKTTYGVRQTRGPLLALLFLIASCEDGRSLVEVVYSRRLVGEHFVGAGLWKPEDHTAHTTHGVPCMNERARRGLRRRAGPDTAIPNVG